MDKELLLKIIGAGFIRSICDEAVLQYVSRDLHCDFLSKDKILLGKVICEKFNGGNNFIGDKPIGLPSVESFLKMLKTLNGEVEATMDNEGRNDKHLVLSDGVLQMKYSLIANSQMPQIPRISSEFLSNIPVTLSINKEFIINFHKLTGAIKDCKYIYVKSTGTSVDLILAQSEDYSTGAKMTYEVTEGESIEILKFNAKMFRGVLYNNRHNGDGTITFHPSGIAFIEFNSEKLKISYHLLAE